MELRIKKTHPEATIPTRAKPGDSGLDLYACIPDYGSVYIRSGERLLVDTGIGVELPAPANVSWDDDGDMTLTGVEAQVRPRSGLSSKGVDVAFGTVDSGYRGSIGVVVINNRWEGYTVRHGDRIAQLVIAPVLYPAPVEVSELSATDRGAGGFGHTGV